MKTSGIYLIKNAVTNKYYIGSAVNFRSRFDNHTSELSGNRHRNRYLQASYNKHGAEAFTFHILEIVEDKTKLIEREQYWLDLTNCCDNKIGYNLSPTAGSILGFKFSPESLQKLSNSLKGKKQTQEHIQRRMTNRRIGNGQSLSEETRALISKKITLIQLGRKLPDAHRQNIAKALRKIEISPERRAKMIAGLRKKKAEQRLTNFNF